MPLSIINRIKESLGAVLSSLFLVGCFCLQAAFLFLPIETVGIAGNHSSDLSAANNTDQSRSLSARNLQQNETKNGKFEETDGHHIQGNGSNGGHSFRRGLGVPFLPEALCFVPIANRIQQKAFDDRPSFIFSDYHKQSFARAGPDRFLMA